MTTLLSDGEGRRCDATCYNAKHNHCDCICGGANHKKGAEAAPMRDHEHFLVFYRTAHGPTKKYGVCEPEDFNDLASVLRTWGAVEVWHASLDATVQLDDEAAE